MKNCLIIDDKAQNEEIAMLEGLGRRSQFPIRCYYFNPTCKECQRKELTPDGKDDFVLDEELIFAALAKQFSGLPFDLIATDYRFSGFSTTGLELVRYLKEKNWKRKAPYIIYSGEAGEIKERLQQHVETILKDANQLNEFVHRFHELNPVRTFERNEKRENSHVQHMYEFLKKNRTDLNVKLSQKLSDNSGRVFKNIFPRFEGKPISYLSELVMTNSEECDVFEDEFLDRSISHFIDLKE